MQFTSTTATKRIIRLDKRIRLLAGGMRASKTISVLLYLIARCQTDTSPTLTSVVSETFPHLERGAIRDFLNIMEGHNYYDEARWNKSNHIYTFETGSKLEFFSADQSSKIRGPSRDRLFVNEANNINQESWEQLLFRTREFAFADWNPVGDFYLYEDYGLSDENGPTTTDDRVDFLILTYKDNEALENSIVEDIERKAKLNPAWSRVYAEGKRGQMEGKIYRDWSLNVTEIPHEARLERRGLDFGYSADPAALIDVYYHNGGYILDEVFYRKGMSNKNIADIITNLTSPNTIVVADSAEPKSIDELKSYGVPVMPANKGQGSITHGIQNVQEKRISVTTRSTNLIKEYRGYLWMTDKEGKPVSPGKPTPGNDHALDALRYAFESLRPVDSLKVFKPKKMLERKYRYA